MANTPSGTFGAKTGMSAMKSFKAPKIIAAKQMKPGKMYSGYTAPMTKGYKGDQPSMASWKPSAGGLNYPKAK